MNEGRAARLESLFDRALDVSDGERRAFLDRECAGDTALRAELEELLAADEATATAALDRWFETADEQAAPLVCGAVVAGRYRIVEQVGAGGMGIVYAADQLQPQRRVALKVVRPGLLGGDALRRFAREAEVLGRLQHPGIAQVLEAGVDGTEPPRAFLVMEFVDGTDLVEHARELPLRTKLARFVDVCEAVAHAHARGVIHRDLKPANVLVTRDGEQPRVKVLDFGVARFVATDGGGQTFLTHPQQVVGTLAYMSPEQVTGDGVDARSDVYALGVTLFQLLTGRLPIDVAGGSLADAARRVCEVEPTRLGELDAALRGDLSTIVGKCLEKEASRRYAHAGELEKDLRRYLNDEPIVARPPSALYQLGKFARRNRALVGGVVATFVALAAGLVVAIALARAADRQRAAAERLAADLRGLMHDVLFEVEESLEEIPGATRAREQLVKVGLRYAERLAAEVKDDARFAFEIGAAYGQLGVIQGGSGEANLGDQSGALTSLRRAKEMLYSSLALDPSAADVHQELISVLQSIASLRRDRGEKEQHAAALAELRSAAERMVELGVDAEIAADAAARAAAEQGRVMMDLGRFEDALAGFEVFRAFVASRYAADGAAVDRDNLGVISSYMAGVEAKLGRFDAARARYEVALELAEVGYAADPDGRSSTGRLAEVHRQLGGFLADQKAVDDALVHYRRSLELCQRLVELDPADVNALRRVGIAHHGIGFVLLEREDGAGALLEFEKFAAICEELCRRSPTSENLRRDLMIARAGIGSAASMLGDVERSETELAAARAASAIARDADPARAQGWADVASMWDDTAEARARLGLAKDDTALLEAAIIAREEQLSALEHMREHGLLDAGDARMLEQVPPLLARLRDLVAERRAR